MMTLRWTATLHEKNRSWRMWNDMAKLLLEYSLRLPVGNALHRDSLLSPEAHSFTLNEAKNQPSTSPASDPVASFGLPWQKIYDNGWCFSWLMRYQLSRLRVSLTSITNIEISRCVKFKLQTFLIALSTHSLYEWRTSSFQGHYIQPQNGNAGAWWAIGRMLRESYWHL